MQRMGALSRQWRAEPALPLSNMIAGALNRLPIAMTTSILGGMLKAIDFVATNVPGMPNRVYLAGAEVTREYAFAPASGAAFSVALLSHGAQCCIGVNIDTTAVPDADELVACLREGFDDVLSGVSQQPSRRDHADQQVPR
jgi:diacylglycerol O-acyltransferase